MIAGAGGAMRATGLARRPPSGFNNCGEGALMASLAERSGEPVDSDKAYTFEIDLRCSPTCAKAACAALCVAMDGVLAGRRRWFVGADRSPGEDSAGDDVVPTRRGATNHDTRRHPATSVSFLGW